MGFLNSNGLKRFKGKIDATYSKKSVSLELVAKAEDWTEEKTMELEATGVTATNNIIVGLGSSATEEELDAAGYARLMCTAQAEGKITLTCFGTVPEIDLPVSIIVLG